MNKKSIFIAIILSISLSDTYASNFWIKELGNGYYTVTGQIQPEDLNLNANGWNFSLVSFQNTSGKNVTDNINISCSSEKEEALKQLNDILSRGITVHNSRSFSSPKSSQVFISFITKYSPMIWSTIAPADISLTPSKCQVKIPDEVQFGEVPKGDSGFTQYLSGNIICNGKNAGTVSLQGTVNKMIKVGDATVSYAFNGGAETDSFTVDKLEPYTISLAFTLVNTGKSTGPKQASVVMLASWE